MAAIKNSINLQDRMTPVFRTIVKSMDSTLKVMQKMDKQANNGAQSKAYKKAEQDIKAANNALIKMGNYTDKTKQSMDRLSNSSGKVANNLSRASGTGFNLVNLSAALYLLTNIKDAITGIMEGPDMAISTKARLGLFNQSDYSKEQLYEQVYRTSVKTRTGLEETGNLVTRILISGAMTGPGAALGSIKAAELINKTLIAGGGTSEENRRSLLQLSQGLASGILQGDELRAIREQTPYLASILAEGLANVDDKFIGTTIGDLKRLGGEGELTADRILKAFFSMEEKINDSFEQMPRTFGQAATVMGGVWKYFLALLNTSEGAIGMINDKVWELTDWLTSASGAEFLNDLANGFTSVVNTMMWMIDVGIQGFTWLKEHADITKSALFALGLMAAHVGTVMFVMWVKATWPMLLILGLFALIGYALYKMGFTTIEILAGVLGAISFILTAAWAFVMWIVSNISVVLITLWNVAVALITAISWVVENTINFVMSIVLSVNSLLTNFFTSMKIGFISLADDALKALQWVASGIDAVFGSSLVNKIEGWRKSVRAAGDDMVDLRQEMEELGLASVDKFWNGLDISKLDPSDNFVDPFAFDKKMEELGLFVNPIDGFEFGKNIAYGLEDLLDGLNADFDLSSGLEDLLEQWDKEGTTFNGGSIDKIGEVGKIGSDVNISEEDIKLLRDVAAREFLLNLQQVTPQVEMNFGDIRETADAYEIIDVLQKMIDEALGSSLVID